MSGAGGFDLAEWHDRMRADLAALERVHSCLAGGTQDEWSEKPLKHWKLQVSRMRALVGATALDRVWKRLAQHEKPWRTVHPYKAPCEALSRVCAEVINPFSVITPPTKKLLSPFELALAKFLDVCKRDPSMVEVIPELSSAHAAAKSALRSIKAFDRSAWVGPLVPATTTGDNWRTNWAALHLRDATFPAYFEGAHHAAIAALITTVFPETPMTSGNVRLLKHGNG